MSSMTSYTVGRPASAQRVYEGWLKYFNQNKIKLMKELRKDSEFYQYRQSSILNEKRLVEIEDEFQLIYKYWNIKTASNMLRESIINRMHQYILKLKVELPMTYDHMIVKQEVSKYLQNLKEESYNIKTLVSKEDNDQKEIVKAKISLMLVKMKLYDSVLYARYKKMFESFTDSISEQKIKLFYDDLKIKYGKIKVETIWTKVYKSSLETFKKAEDMKNNLDLLNSIEGLCNQKQITESNYNKLYKRIQEKIISEHNKKKNVDVDTIVTALEQLNYLVIDENRDQIVSKLSNKKKVELSVKDKDYRVVIKLNDDNKLLTRFVRVVKHKEDVKRLSTSERLQDAENLKKWCRHQKDFMHNLKGDGSEIDQTIIEDEESEILYVVDSSKEVIQRNNRYTKERGA